MISGLRQISRTMSMSSRKLPPAAVKGLTVWDPEAFRKTIQIPSVRIKAEFISVFKKQFEKYLLKIPNLPYVQELKDDKERRKILLDPDCIQRKEDFSQEEVDRLAKFYNVEGVDLEDFNLSIDNWRPHELLEAVLRDDESKREGLKSYSIIGHIAHVNLKDELLPFKDVIGQILLRNKIIRTVVNKTSAIDSTFRQFSMEILAGEDGNDAMKVTVKENGCQFEMDFSKVYWNPRLCTEHARVVAELPPDVVLFDVFAGVGPFSVPAAKKKSCRIVHANDLNPESYKWLVNNSKINKIMENRFKCYNLDGREFIRTVVKEDLLSGDNAPRHVVMNLPALAVEFLDAFCGLVDSDVTIPSLTVHVYSFSMEGKTDLIKRCSAALECLLEEKDVQVAFVRNVAPKKDMFRASFTMPKSVLQTAKDESKSKKPKLC